MFIFNGTPSCVYCEQEEVSGRDRTVLSSKPGSDKGVIKEEMLVTGGGVAGAAGSLLQGHFTTIPPPLEQQHF